MTVIIDTPRVTFEAADDGQAALLSNLQERCYSPQDERSWSTESFCASLQNRGSHAKIMRLRDAPIGFYLTQRVEDEIEIQTLGVVPALQGKGFGGQLLNSLMAEGKAEGVSRVLLEVRRDNAAAITLYKNTGFSQVGLRSKYYMLRSECLVDALILSCNL